MKSSHNHLFVEVLVQWQPPPRGGRAIIDVECLLMIWRSYEGDHHPQRFYTCVAYDIAAYRIQHPYESYKDRNHNSIDQLQTCNKNIKKWTNVGQ
jgi:hypothetical protein